MLPIKSYKGFASWHAWGSHRFIRRDLSKPIGALNAKRLAEFRERFIELRRMCEASNIKLPGSLQPLEFPPFLYGMLSTRMLQILRI